MRFLLLLVIVGTVWKTEAQTPFDAQLRAAKHDTTRLRIYHQIARFYSRESQNDSAWRYIQRALPLAHKYPKNNLLRLYHRMGLHFRAVNKYDSSLYYSKKGLELANQEGNIREAVGIRYLLAIVYSDKGDKKASYIQLMDNLNYYEKKKSYKWSAASYGLLSVISWAVGRGDRIPYFKQKQVEYRLKYGDNEEKMLAYISIADKNKDDGNFKAAYANLTIALSMAEQHSTLDQQLFVMMLLAENCVQQRKWTEALYFQNKKLEKAKPFRLATPLAESYSDISSIYLELGKPKMALNYAQAGYQWALKSKRPECILASMKELINAHKANKHYQVAFRLQEKQTGLYDSLSFLSQAAKIDFFEAQQVATMQALREDTLAKSLKINKLYISRLQSEKRLYWISFGLGAFILAVVLYFWRQTFRMNKLLSEKKRQVEQQTEELKETNQIKDKLFGIIGHDLRAPLVSFQTQMQLFENNRIDAPSFLKQFKQVQNNVRKLYQTLDNLLYWSLSQQKKLKPHPRTLALAELIEDVLPVYEGLINEKNLRIENRIHSVQIYADEQHVKIILANVLQNAFKFSPTGGLITLTSRANDSSVSLTVTNDVEPEEKVSSNQTGTKLGLVIIEELMKKNKGSHQVENQTYGTFRIRLEWQAEEFNS